MSAVQTQANTALDYDLDVFAPRQQRQRQPLKVVKSEQKKKLGRINWRSVSVMALAALALALIVAILMSQTTVTELTGSIQDQQANLVELQSEYAYLNNELEMKSNVSEVEEYAETQLGLVKLDKSQVSYVSGGETDTVTRNKTGFGRIADGFSKGLLSVMEYFTS